MVLQCLWEVDFGKDADLDVVDVKTLMSQCIGVVHLHFLTSVAEAIESPVTLGIGKPANQCRWMRKKPALPRVLRGWDWWELYCSCPRVTLVAVQGVHVGSVLISNKIGLTDEWRLQAWKDWLMRYKDSEKDSFLGVNLPFQSSVKILKEINLSHISMTC